MAPLRKGLHPWDHRETLHALIGWAGRDARYVVGGGLGGAVLAVVKAYDGSEGDPMSHPKTCPICGDVVSNAHRTSDSIQLQPCGHSIPAGHRKDSSGDYVPEDLAAREAVDHASDSTDGQLRELLAYCRSKAAGAELGQEYHQADINAAYGDVVERLRSILDDE